MIIYKRTHPTHPTPTSLLVKRKNEKNTIQHPTLPLSVMPRTVVQKIVESRWQTVSRQFMRNKVRGDTIIALGIPIACLGVLIEAYYRTDYHDADTSSEAQFTPSNDCIDAYGCRNHKSSSTTSVPTSMTKQTKSCSDWNGNANMIVQSLERDGIVIIPNAISATTLSAVRDNIQRLQQQPSSNHSHDTHPYVFATSGNDTDVRQDNVVWVRNGTRTNISSCEETDNSDQDELASLSSMEHTGSAIGQDLEFCINFVRGISFALEKNGYTLSNQHRIPKQCQLSMYSGDNISSYQRHLDTCTGTIYDLGLLEYWRLSDYRERRITIILYLNESHRPVEHGGILRCWVSKDLSQHHSTPPLSPPNQSTVRSSRCNDRDNSATRENTIFFPSLDVQPKGGTLVIFQSQR